MQTPRTLRIVTFGQKGHRLTSMAVEVVSTMAGLDQVGHVDSADSDSPLRDPNTAEARSLLAELKPDLFLSAGYTRLLQRETLTIPSIGAINVHPSLLPQYRGSHPIYWALYEGQPAVGVTIHKMTLPVDSGRILAQEKVHVRALDRPDEVYDSVCTQAAVALERSLRSIQQTRTINGRAQIGKGSYRGNPWKELDRLMIDWSEPAATLARRSRAFPGVLNFRARRRLVFIAEIFEAGATSAEAGTIVRRRFRSLEVAAGDNRSVKVCLSRPARSWLKLLGL
jgi:methionyl-tRNA formyltransferase